MSLKAHSPRWTPAEVLEWERQQVERYEYLGGVLRMMVGGTLAHNAITNRLWQALDRQLRPAGCRAFTENVRLVLPNGDFTYPDVLVSCAREPMTADSVTDAVLIAEVLSRSTADHDRGEKWEAYRLLPGLQAYLLAAQDRRYVELYRRDGAGWRFTSATDGIVEPMPGVAVALDEIYADLE